jgi:hypothetical protein
MFSKSTDHIFPIEFYEDYWDAENSKGEKMILIEVREINFSVLHIIAQPCPVLVSEEVLDFVASALTTSRCP